METQSEAVGICWKIVTSIFGVAILNGLLLADEAKVIIETKTDPAAKLRVYSGTASSVVSISQKQILHEIDLTITVHSGTEGAFSFEWFGDAKVESVNGKGVASWAMRKIEKRQFLEVVAAEKDAKSLVARVIARTTDYELPVNISLSNLGKGRAVALNNQVTVNFAAGVFGSFKSPKSFQSIKLDNPNSKVFQTSTGGELVVRLANEMGRQPNAQLIGAKLVGTLDIENQTVAFRLTGSAVVTDEDEEEVRLPILSGKAAVTRNRGSDYKVELVREGGQLYYALKFDEAGEFDIDLDIAARLENKNTIDFKLMTADILPVQLAGLDKEHQLSAPSWQFSEDQWQGFADSNGAVKLTWNPRVDRDKGELFYSTIGKIETQIGTGLARQSHQIDYQILQGKLAKLEFKIVGGETEIVSVTGTDILSWEVNKQTLIVQLSKPAAKAASYVIKTQASLDDLPTSISPIRLEPLGSIRHSGYIRLVNEGSVRIEPNKLSGLTQLMPDKFPGKAVNSRQTFVYRFPAKEYQYQVSCGRIQSEVLVSEIVHYQVSDTERTISTAVELDIREAPIREWNLLVPEDYSVITVTGAGIADYVVGTEVTDGQRNLKCIYSADVIGRKLIRLVLEKNLPAADGLWELPRLDYPDAKSYRCDLGISASPGFRLALDAKEKLVERPLSDFPGEAKHLQHYLRVRESDWQANVQIVGLPQSIQADCFHLYSLGEGRAFGSVLVNYLITGAPVSEFSFSVPEGLDDVVVETKNLRSQQLVDGQLSVSLHQPILGSQTLLITFEQDAKIAFNPGQITPLEVASETGYIQLVSPLQVGLTASNASANLLELDHLELPPEFRLLSSAPSLGVWQYSERPLTLSAEMEWLEPGDTLDQVIEFSEASTTISYDDEMVTDLVYYVKSQDSRPLSLTLPAGSKIWDVRFNGRNVASRQNGAVTQIPLQLSKPGGLSEVRLRVGSDIKDNKVALPVLNVPVLKTQWQLLSEQGLVTDIRGDHKNATNSVVPPKGLSGVAAKGGLFFFGVLVLVIVGIILGRVQNWVKWLAPVFYLAAAGIAIWASVHVHDQIVEPRPLTLNLPVIASGESIELETKIVSLNKVDVSFFSIAAFLLGCVCLLAAAFKLLSVSRSLLLMVGVFLLGLGFLLVSNGAFLFFIYLAAIVLLLLIPFARGLIPVAATSLVIGFASMATAAEVNPTSMDSIKENWKVNIKEGQITVDVQARVALKRGRVFKLANAKVVLTNFDSNVLGLRKLPNAQKQIEYYAVVPSSDDRERAHNFSYTYQLSVAQKQGAIAIPTGSAAVHEVRVSVNEAGWQVASGGAAKVVRKGQVTTLSMLPQGPFFLSISPVTRDLTEENSEFYVESQQVYIPSPGVVDGSHSITFRSSRGQIKEATFQIPEGLTVSEVQGPIKSWRFNPNSRQLVAIIDPPQAATFAVNITTQSGLSALPAQTTLRPITVKSAAGETGLLALGFSGEAQPEKVTAIDGLLQVNIDDYSAAIPPNVVLHQVYRYRSGQGALVVDVAEVAPEIRSASRQVISIGDEDLLYQVNYNVEISRSGIFRLSIPIPEGCEINSLTGQALSHWTETTSDTGEKEVILHLNGKTIGKQSFVLSLLASTPPREQPWTLPAFPIAEASRHTGEIIIQPATGIRLTLAERQNAIELDPRELGATQKGALAFRTLQKDWLLKMGIENRAPRFTCEILHDLKIREAQVQHSIRAQVKIENAATRSLSINLPIPDAETEKNLRITGRNVSGFAKSDENKWIVQLKRWTLGNVELTIDWEQRQQVDEQPLPWQPISVDSVRQPVYYLSVRPSGRLEAELPEGNRDWRRVDWNAVPDTLRKTGQRTAPSLALRASTTAEPVSFQLKRHTLADALKLRIERGVFNTVVSPLAGRLTAAELEIEVIQRGHLTMTLPLGSEMFSLFVNRETVQPVRVGNTQWRFPIQPNAISRKAQVTVIYVEQFTKIENMNLVGPAFGIPMENITWNVLAPETYNLVSQKGNLSFLERDATLPMMSRQQYLDRARKLRSQREDEAVKLLTRANQLIQEGKAIQARQALNSLANRSGLDAASNEDARVQLETLQTQQALVGLNSRKQRLYLDYNHDVEIGAGSGQSNDKQIVESASRNPVIQLGDLNFRPNDLSQLLQGNSSEELAAMRKIAARMIEQQQREVLSMPGLDIMPPLEGKLYQFSKTLQVNDKAPLQLELGFRSNRTGAAGGQFLMVLLLVLFSGGVMVGWRRMRG